MRSRNESDKDQRTRQERLKTKRQASKKISAFARCEKTLRESVSVADRYFFNLTFIIFRHYEIEQQADTQ